MKKTSQLEVAQERQEFFKDLASHFEDTPLFEQFKEVGVQWVQRWEYLEWMEKRRLSKNWAQ